MLISFAFENFKSYAGPAHFSMVAHKADKALPGAPFVVHGEADLILLPAAAIYGPNAAGKTNLLLALEYMREAVRDSQRHWEVAGGTSVAQSITSGAQETTFEVLFYFEGTKFRYGFSCTSACFNKEWLYYYPVGRERTLFERVTSISDDGAHSTRVKFGKSLSGSLRHLTSISEKVRPNSLFVSAAAQDNQAECQTVYRWFVDKVTINIGDRWNPSPNIGLAARLCQEYESFKSSAMALLRAADSNIVDIIITQREPGAPPSDTVDGLGASSVDWVKQNLSYSVDFVSNTPTGTAVLPFAVQSRGVKRLFEMLSTLEFGRELGEVLLIDEIEVSLHPHIVNLLVSIYQSRSTNKTKAQLIFTTHDTRLLNPDCMRRDQIWFVERENGESHLYPLTDFSPRKDESLEKGYLRGRYGAVPSLGFDPDAFQSKALS